MLEEASEDFRGQKNKAGLDPLVPLTYTQLRMREFFFQGFRLMKGQQKGAASKSRGQMSPFRNKTSR